jgi:serine/threonine protein kinase
MWSKHYRGRAGLAEHRPLKISTWQRDVLAQYKTNPRAFRLAVEYAKKNGKFRRKGGPEQVGISWYNYSILCLKTHTGKAFCVLISNILVGAPGAHGVAKIVFMINDGTVPTINDAKPMVLKIIHDTETISPEVGVSSLDIWQKLHPDATLGSAQRTLPDPDKQKCYLLIPYLEGKDLFDVLMKRSVKKYLARLAIASAVIRAVENFHIKTLCAHRDIKPENIKMQGDDKTWRATLLDFDPCMDMTPGKKFGTLCYMAPEVFSAKRNECPPYTIEGDVYSLGMVLLEILVPSGNTLEILNQQEIRAIKLDSAIIHSLLASDPEIKRLPVDIKDFIVRMLSEDKINRPALKLVAQAFSAELEKRMSTSFKEKLRPRSAHINAASPLLFEEKEPDGSTSWCPCFSWW